MRKLLLFVLTVQISVLFAGYAVKEIVIDFKNNVKTLIFVQ